MKNALSACFKVFRSLLSPAAAVAVLLAFLFALSSLEDGHGEEGRRQLETALRRAAVACYATEGSYPSSLSDLEQRFGLQIDQDRYTVFYEIFAENLMPSITVLEKES